ncbi:MAG: radical SAM protein, partial [Acidobacteria bacterium]
QIGETSYEILPASARRQVVQDLLGLRKTHPKLDMPAAVIEGFLSPPPNPDKCIFAKTTYSVTADLKTRLGPCQFGGNPDCSQCGCIASVGLHQIGQHKLGGVIPVAWLYNASYRIGRTVASIRAS